MSPSSGKSGGLWLAEGARRLLTRAPGALLVLVLLASCREAQDESREWLPRAVVLISVDTLRADHLSLYGYHRPTTPFLDELASESIVFDTFVNNGGGTLPSHMTMMTSLHPSAHGVSPHGNETLRDAEMTLAESLHEAGYATAAFVDSGWMKGRFGFSQGFDLYDDEGGRLAGIRGKAEAWLDRHADRRFFLFVHTYDVHSQAEGPPYHCPDDWFRRYEAEVDGDLDDWRVWGGTSRHLAAWNEEIRNGNRRAEDFLDAAQIASLEALYDGCINYVDEQLRILVDNLRERDLYDSTLLVITSDHGEEFAEHGYFMHTQGGFEETVRIPLLIKLPQSRGGGRRVTGLASMVDLMPTILDVVGLPPTPRSQGESLLPIAFGEKGGRRAAHLQGAVRTTDWKYISNRSELYHLRTDPEERHDVSSQNPETVERLHRYLEDRLGHDRQVAAELPSVRSMTLSSEEAQQLRALGYLN